MMSSPSPPDRASTPPGDSKWDRDFRQLILPVSPRAWGEPGTRPWRVIVAGLWLGALAGCASLMVNVIGSVAWPAISGEAQHPLRLIQVYLTFPLGSWALQLSSGWLLALGCLLYLGTGMLYGALFEWLLFFLLPHASLRVRLVACTVLAILVWLASFYAVLSWLQPLLFGGRWILDLVPWWVAGATHLVFGWTMALLYPLGVRH